jgi:hypothetical protein
MKILGADGLTVGLNAADKIPASLVSSGDACCAKYSDKFYWYILEESGAAENLPHVIKLDNATSVGDNSYTGSKRWALKNIYLTELEVDDIITSSIYAPSGGTIDLNNVATLSGSQFIFENTTEAPFTVNSTTMVDNLNAEFLNGLPASTFDLANILVSDSVWVSEGIDELYVSFPEPRFNTTYSLFTDMYNEISGDPSLISHMVTSKTNSGFTVKMSAQTDNSFYRLQWAVLGENIQYDSYNLIDQGNDNILTIGSDNITVL